MNVGFLRDKHNCYAPGDRGAYKRESHFCWACESEFSRACHSHDYNGPTGIVLYRRMFALGAEIREALQHAIKVNKEGSCQWPRARVIPVRDVYPSPSTTYIPHCAILHRCSDDTGCCRSEALTCVPKHSHRVELSFYVSSHDVVTSIFFYL